MDVFVALYRGVNVVGKNLVKMESLRAMHERLGHQGVKSYIQSGNVVFSADESAGAIARTVAAGFIEEFGFAPRVVVVNAKNLGAIVQRNPYAKLAAENPTTVHAAICEGGPNKKQLTALLAKTGGSESFAIGKRVVYLHAPDGYGRSKFAAGMEKACGVPMTVRNWRTVETLWKMVSAVK
jgi:uncharacterized protein (DUF1697 family)